MLCAPFDWFLNCAVNDFHFIAFNCIVNDLFLIFWYKYHLKISNIGEL